MVYLKMRQQQCLMALVKLCLFPDKVVFERENISKSVFRTFYWTDDLGNDFKLEPQRRTDEMLSFVKLNKEICTS